MPNTAMRKKPAMIRREAEEEEEGKKKKKMGFGLFDAEAEGLSVFIVPLLLNMPCMIVNWGISCYEL